MSCQKDIYIYIYRGLYGIIEIKFKMKCNIRVKATSRRVRVNIVTVKKATNITYSEYMFVVLFIQFTKRMLGVTLSSVAIPAVQNICTLSPNNGMIPHPPPPKKNY